MNLHHTGQRNNHLFIVHYRQNTNNDDAIYECAYTAVLYLYVSSAKCVCVSVCGDMLPFFFIHFFFVRIHYTQIYLYHTDGYEQYNIGMCILFATFNETASYFLLAQRWPGRQ